MEEPYKKTDVPEGYFDGCGTCIIIMVIVLVLCIVIGYYSK